MPRPVDIWLAAGVRTPFAKVEISAACGADNAAAMAVRFGSPGKPFD